MKVEVNRNVIISGDWPTRFQSDQFICYQKNNHWNLNNSIDFGNENKSSNFEVDELKILEF